MGSNALRGVQSGKEILLLDLRYAGFEIQPFLGNLDGGLTAQSDTGH